MACPSCGGESVGGAKFCARCGAALAAACPACGHLNGAGARFCVECGGTLESGHAPVTYTPEPLAEKIRFGRTELEGERKQITVLFADVVGFTSMSSQIDPEDAHAVIRACFDVMLDEVHRYEGTVSQFLGDGLLALFGAPIAHEDHAYRAVRAALAIQQAITQREDIGVRVRVGLNSGPVVVSRVGVDLTMDYLAVGDTVNLASRMQSLADPGSVVLSENTRRLVEGIVELEELGDREVKGKDQPVRVYRALRPSRWRSRVDRRVAEGLAPFVGRDRELDALLDRFEAAANGAGQAVLIGGEAGLGKSRLVHELRTRTTDDAMWLVGRCISYGADVSYLPLIDLLKDAFDIDEGDTAAEIRAKVDARVAELAVSSDDLPVLLYLLNAEEGGAPVAALAPAMRKARIFESLRTLLLAAAEARPVVVLIEDLHWVDRLSLEVLSFVLERLPHHRVMLLLTHRPGWDQPFGTPPHLTRLDLHPLAPGDSNAIATAVLGSGTLPPEFERLVHRKAEGNPFFVEEVTRALVELGTLRREGNDYVLTRALDDVLVPDTIQDVIMARLDRLPTEPRKALQTASVIGREFSERLLSRTAELGPAGAAALRELRSVELIHERSLYPELAYMFKHALTHEVAYTSLLLQRRRALHALVGVAIEELYADRLAEHYEMLAHHFELAEDWQRAAKYLLLAGQKTLAALDAQSALAYFDRALVVDSKADSSASDIAAAHAGRGEALFLLSRMDDSAAAYDDMAAASAGDPGQEAFALFQAGSSLFWGHRFEDALERTTRARAIAEAAGATIPLGGALLLRAFVLGVTGDLDGAVAALDEAKPHITAGGFPLLLGLEAYWRSLILHWRGEERDAARIGWDGVAVGREHGLPTVLVEGLWQGGLALAGAGRYDEALAFLREQLELTERLGERLYRCRTLNTIGWVHMDLLDWERGLSYNRQALEESLLVGDPEIIRNAQLNIADCLLARGETDEARAILEQVERESAVRGTWGEEWMKWRYSMHLFVSLGRAYLEGGDAMRALDYADRCCEAATAKRAPRYQVRGGRLRAEALLALGRDDDALAAIDEVLASPYPNPAQRWRSLAARADVLNALGRVDEANAGRNEAVAVLRELGASLSDAELRASVLHSEELAALQAP